MFYRFVASGLLSLLATLRFVVVYYYNKAKRFALGAIALKELKMCLTGAV